MPSTSWYLFAEGTLLRPLNSYRHGQFLVSLDYCACPTQFILLRSAALLSIFILSFILIPTQFIFFFVPLRYTQLSFFHSFSSQHSLFSSSFRCATFNIPSFIHSYPNTVYFSLPSAALLSTFILSFILIQFMFRSKRLKTFFVVSLGQPRPT